MSSYERAQRTVIQATKNFMRAYNGELKMFTLLNRRTEKGITDEIPYEEVVKHYMDILKTAVDVLENERALCGGVQ